MDNLARVIELWTKIPASKIREEEFKRLSELRIFSVSWPASS